MIRRAAQPETDADIRLKACIGTQPGQCFVVVAGAGSGKTTSLIKGLASIIRTHGVALTRSRQRVACITYTEIAAGEIWADVGNNPLIHVSTIHSFFWSIVRAFQGDIRGWVGRRIDEKLSELHTTAEGFGPRVQARTREKNRRDIARYEQQHALITSVQSFTYGTGSDYPQGVLGHDDVIKLVTEFLMERPLFRTLVGQQFPFVLVDESQDTMPPVVAALKAIERQLRPKFCLGFFGDPMQQIYQTGAGKIEPEDTWVEIPKPENFRCPTTVLAVANAIRRGGDDLVQVGGRVELHEGEVRPVPGTARIFVLPADERRDEQIRAVREWIALRNDDPAWRQGERADVKVLVIVHRMAAMRMGFADLYAAMNDRAPEAFKNGFLDATAWPLRPFMSFVLPLSDATRSAREFEAITILRDKCPLFAKESLKEKNVVQVLAAVRASCARLAEMMRPGSDATTRDVLRFLRDANLVALDPRLVTYLEELPRERPAHDDDDDDGEDLSREIASMDAFLQCAASQFWGYREYVDHESPFSTQQGIKGAEFPRVLVILDDAEGTHSQFSYDKYFGIKPPSDRDRENERERRETTVDRTRRLFYVCCTRARLDLAVVLFAADVVLAERCVRAAGIFPADAVHTRGDLND